MYMYVFLRERTKYAHKMKNISKIAYLFRCYANQKFYKNFIFLARIAAKTVIEVTS